MKKLSIILFVALISIATVAQSPAKRAKEFNLENKVALQGFDPVSYFKGKPSKGKTEIATTFEGVVYYFSTQSNKDIFTKNPSQYEPQYGGWCAFAMGSSGEKVEINPETFKIIDGKLYVFYNAYFNNTLKSWNKDDMNLKKKAETNWKKFIN